MYLGYYLAGLVGGGKESILRGKEVESMLYTQNNEIQQAMFKKRGDGNVTEGVTLFQVHCIQVWNYLSEILYY
jgi:hypothetical protein